MPKKISDNVFLEKNATRYVAKVLESGKKFACYLNDNDRTPDVDGSFDILIGSVPQKKYIVQVKHLKNALQKNTKSQKYHISFKTAFFRYIYEKVSNETGFYFLADEEREEIVFLKIDNEFFADKETTQKIFKQGSLVFELKEENILKNIEDFYILCREDAQTQLEKNLHIEKNKISEFKAELSRINSILSDLDFITTAFFGNNYEKIGIAYDNTEDSVNMGIYTIGLDELTSDILAYNESSRKYLQKSKYFKHSSLVEAMKPTESLTRFAKSLIDKYFENALFPLKYLNDECLMDVIFSFLDKMTSHFDNEKYFFEKKVISIIECTDLIFPYFSFFSSILTDEYVYNKDQKFSELRKKVLQFPSKNDVISIRTFLQGNEYEIPIKIEGSTLRYLTKEDHLTLLSIFELQSRKVKEIKRYTNIELDYKYTRNEYENYIIKNADYIYKQVILNYNLVLEKVIKNYNYKLKGKNKICIHKNMKYFTMLGLEIEFLRFDDEGDFELEIIDDYTKFFKIEKENKHFISGVSGLHESNLKFDFTIYNLFTKLMYQRIFEVNELGTRMLQRELEGFVFDKKSYK